MSPARIAPLVLAAITLAGQGYAIAAGRELYPFTCAPMFAHDIRPDAPTYELAFLVQTEGEPVPMRLADLGLLPSLHGRFLFASVYGSANPDWPVDPGLEQDRAAMEQRLSAWFAGLMEVMYLRSPRLAARTRAIELVVLHDPRGSDVRTVGSWDASTGRYAHTWGP